MIQATLAEQAYWELRRRIVSGEFAPGRRLLPRELAAMLDISQTPVKEALLLLERDGLVECPSRRGATVRRFSPQEINEVFEARTLLECAALASGLQAGRVTEAFLGDLENMLRVEERQNSTHGIADPAEAIRIDCDFHEALVSLAGNSWVAQWHRALLHQTQTACAIAGAKMDPVRSGHDHAAILESLRARDPEAAIGVLRRHLAADCGTLLPAVGT